MFVIIAPIQIKEGHRDAFVESMIDDAKGSVENEPGCLRFDVIQDGADPNRIWLYEVYVGRSSVPRASESSALHQMAGYRQGLVC